MQKITPQCIKNIVNKKLLEREEKRVLDETLRKYDMMCVSDADVPGLVILNPYVKSNKIFDGIQYYSQFYQDYYLDHYIFAGKKNGVFLDVGGNNPIHINNTYFFKLNRNWSGLAFEPMPKMYSKWKEYRAIKCLPVAVGSRNGESEFCECEDDYMSGIVKTVDYNGKVSKRYKVKVLTLKSVFKKYNINHVDFMSVDVEGAELDVLNGIDFNEVVIDYIVIENNKGIEKEREIRSFLVMHRYKLKARLWIGEIWEKKD